jgi:5-formyltetrahydrofolate cyclo-ligase
MIKKELRKIYLKKRMELSEGEFRELNQQICDNFFVSIDLSKINVIHTFLPIEKNREVNTWLIIDRLTRQFPGIRISVPKINNQTAVLEHYYFEGKDQLKNNTWEIPEPVRGLPTPLDKIDAVLVPLLAFDKLGNRLGYGRGFYDRFLAECRPDCLKIGLSIFEMEEKIEGMDKKDVPLNMIVTPEKMVAIL